MTIKMVKSNGKLRPTAQGVLDAFTERVEEGGEVLAELRVVGADRSLNQNALFHKLVDRYSKTIGEGRDYCKDELCINFGIAVEIDVADGFGLANTFMEPPPWPGHLVMLWSRYFIRKSTTAYTVKEMNELIDATMRAIVACGGEVGDLQEERRVVA